MKYYLKSSLILLLCVFRLLYSLDLFPKSSSMDLTLKKKTNKKTVQVYILSHEISLLPSLSKSPMIWRAQFVWLVYLSIELKL